MTRVSKLSVSLANDDLSWAKARAKSLGISLSGVLSESLRRQRQAEARAQLLAALGTDDIKSEDLEAFRRELHEKQQTTAQRRKRKR
jgi:hypothetical protein